MNQFSADVQRELPYAIALEIGYTGSRSSHLQENYTGTSSELINQLNPSYFSLGSALNKSVPNPFYGNGGTGVIGAATVSQAQLLLPYPEYGAISALDNPASARFDSVFIKVQKRLARGLTFLSTLTWSRNEDNEVGGGSASSFNGFTGSTPPSAPQNYYNLSAEWALLRWMYRYVGPVHGHISCHSAKANTS